jgi:hypothetical protein
LPENPGANGEYRFVRATVAGADLVDKPIRPLTPSTRNPSQCVSEYSPSAIRTALRRSLVPPFRLSPSSRPYVTLHTWQQAAGGGDNL